MTTYISELKNSKNFKGNVVIRFLGKYFAQRAPDSGLVISSVYDNLVSSVVVNRTTVDPRRVSTTISNLSVTMLDKKGALSALVKDTGASLIGQTVEIWIGRSGVSMPFSEYKKLPDTKVKKISQQNGVYTFSSVGESDRINRPVYDLTTRLASDVLFNSTDFVCKDSIDDYPASGYLKLDHEFVFYASKNNGTKTFQTLTRGALGTTAVPHTEDTETYVVEQVEANPLDIILQLLTSGGGGGAYDVLVDGLGISQSLIDVTAIEALRDLTFPTHTYRLGLYNISNALQFIEKELLEPNNLRFTYSRDSKITLALLNSSAFVEELDVMTHDSIHKSPKVDIDDNKIVNRIKVEWGYDESTGDFLERSEYSDAASIAAYGEKTPLSFQFKGLKSDLEGQTLVDAFANGLLERLSTPTPEITLNAFVSKSLLNVGDKTFLRTDRVPNANGRLNFAEEIEIIEQAINFQTGDVAFKLAFTTYTGSRPGYIAPSDSIAVVTAQDVVEVGAGRGDLWLAGWKVRLWNNTLREFESDPVNEIASMDGDEITFVTPWLTTLGTHHKIKFADYDDVTDEQKRYCFVSINNRDFSADERQYKIIA